MAGKWSNATSPGEWIRNGEVSRESYLWVINPLLYPRGPVGAMELGDGGAQERWRSGSGTQEGLVIRWVGSVVCSWWWLRWLWLPDSTPSSRGDSLPPTMAKGPVTASGCGLVWVAVMEIVEKRGILKNHPRPPRIFPLACNPPSQSDISSGWPVNGSPRSLVLGRWRVPLELRKDVVLMVLRCLGEKERRAWKVRCGMQGEYDIGLGVEGGRWPHLSASQWWRDLWSGDSASGRVGGGADPGLRARPDLQGGGDIGFPFWASRWSRLAKSGDTDLFFPGPLDGAIDDGWWNNSFWSGGLFRSMNTGDGVRLDILVSRSIGDGKLKRSKEIPAGQAGV